jgi:putative inorganic carbon (HCO3(-)) transporter
MIFAFALLFLVLHLLSPAEIFPALAPYRVLLIIAAITGLLSIPVMVHSLALPKLRTQVLLVLAFFCWVSGSWIFHRWLGGVLPTFINLAPTILIYFVAIVQFHKPSRLRILRFALVGVALYIFAMAVSQIPQARATGAQTPYVMVGEEDMRATEVRIRGLGMLHDPNYYGQFLLMILPFMFVGSRPNAGLGIGYLFAVPVSLVMITGIYLTNSRGSQLGLVLLIGLFLWKRYRQFGAIAAAILGPIIIIGINATRSRSISISGGVDRLALWSDGLGMFKRSPLWGIGYYKFADNELLTAHNTFLLCAAEMGIVGLLLWMSLVVVTIILLRRVPAAVAATDPVLARWAEAIQLSLYVYLFTSFFLSRLYDPPLYLLIGMAGGVIATAGGQDKLCLRGGDWPVWAGGLSVASLVLIYVLVRLRMVA